MKKLSLTVMGLAVAGVLSFGASTLSESKQAGHGDYPVSKDDFKQYAAHGDTPAPQKPGLTYTHGDHGGSPADNKGDTGGIISNTSVEDPGGGMISNKSVSDPGTGSPSYSHADLPTPQA